MIKGFFNKMISLKRKTDILVDWTNLLSLLESEEQPLRECNLVLKVQNTISGGTIIITGTVGGQTGITEQFLFSGNQGRQSLKRFTAISGITSEGLSGGQLKIKSAERGGQPVYQEVLIASGIKIQLDSELRRGSYLEFGISGGFTELNFKLVCSKKDGELMEIADILEENTNKYEIQKIVSILRRKKDHHFEGVLKKLGD